MLFRLRKKMPVSKEPLSQKMKPPLISLFRIAAVAILLAASSSIAATFTVTNTENAGTGSFRQAVNDATAAGGNNTIVFSFPGAGPQIIGLQSRLVLNSDLSILNDRIGDVPVTIKMAPPPPPYTFDATLQVRPGRQVVIAGVTISDGIESGLHNEGELTLRHCILRDNEGYQGGAIRNTGILTMSDCTLSDNSGGTGGGLLNDGGRATLLNCVIRGNRAGQGGGILNDGSRIWAELNLINCVVTDNWTDDSMGIGGGGIANFGPYGGASLTLVNCTFNNHRANSDEFGGGALLNFGLSGQATLVARNCTFTNNQAKGGGAFYDYGSVLSSATFDNCTFSGNAAITNSFGGGGAVLANYQYTSGVQALLRLNNCTFSNNFAGATDGTPYNGGAIACGGQGPKVEVSNSLFRRGNSGRNLASGGPTLISLGHNLSDDDASGDGGVGPGGLLNGPGDIRNTDPLLGSLTDNGGPTQTHSLLPGSVAIGSGDDTKAPHRDQRGCVRSGVSDIGAYEFEGRVPVARLANISTRVRCLTNDNILIAGFIVTGTQGKRVMVRAIGPSLAGATHLNNPTLELHDSSGQVVAVNDNWADAPNRQEIIDSTIPPTHDLESAILMTLPPGAYTAAVRGVNNSTGIALAEIYDLDPGVDSKLGNISTRGFVQFGDNVMIGGFIVVGPDTQTVVIRAIGPSLPVPEPLADPELELHDGNGGLIAINYEWTSDRAAIIATGLTPSNDLECAIVTTLVPGNYTAIVRGTKGATGVALVEAYGVN